MIAKGGSSPSPVDGLSSQGREQNNHNKLPSNHQGCIDQKPDPSRPTHAPIHKFFEDVDWDKSAIGPAPNWDSDLRHISRFLLADTSPAVLFWGESSTILYNEAYLPLLGNKHPGAMGMDASEVFPMIWDQLAGQIAEQRRTRQTETCAGTMLLIEKNGHLEETYFDWKLIPVTDDEGEVKGSYGIPLDRTLEVICSRQNDCIQRLSRHTGTANNMKELWQTLLTGLSYNSKDIPFALLYSMDEQLGISSAPSKPSYPCHLEGTIGVGADRVIEQEYIDLSCDINGFAPTMLKALKCDSLLILESDDPSLHKLLNGLGLKGHELPSEQFAIIPVKDDGRIAAFMVVGLNPYRRYNKQFCEFLQLVADIAAPQVSRARLSEEVARHNELARRAQLDRRRSDMRFSRFAEWSIVGLAVIDVEGKILYANDAWYKFSGLSPADQQTLSWFDSVVPEDVDLLRQWQRRVLYEKKGGAFQIRSKEPFRRGHMSSDHRTGICACYADLNELNEVESVMVFTMDISELKWTEQQLISRSKALEESEKKWRNYAEHCPFGICRTDGDGYVQYGNKAWFSFYGFKPDEIPKQPQPWLPWVREDYVQPCKEFFAKLQRGPGLESVEFQLVNKTYTISGGDKTVTNGAYVVATGFSQFKEDGTIDHMDFWVTDISGQKMAVKVLTDKMEEAIRSKTQQERFMDMISHEIRNPLSAVLHCSEEIIESIKKGSAVLDWVFHDNAIRDSGKSGKEILKKQISSALEAANTIVYCVQHQKQIVDDVLTVSKLDSDLLVVSPIPVQPMALVRSSLKIFDAELKMTDIKLKVIEDNSLSTLGLDWVLLDPNRFLQIVINLVTNAIKFTKTSKVKEIVVTASAQTHRPFESELGVEFVPQRYSPATPASATSAVPDSKDVNPESDIFLCFSVKDTGKGLTKDEKALVFNRFSQASPKTHIEYGGSGLGLFIARQITEMLGGEIGLTSSPGSGCTFAFYIKTQRCEMPHCSPISTEPVIRLSRSLSITANGTPMTSEEEDDEFPLGLREPSTPRPEESPLKVLVVEDNLVNQKVLCKQLRNRDFLVKAANHGRDALDAVRDRRWTEVSDEENPFDVILCDIEMPVMDGIEFTKEVRRLEAEGELAGHVPILGVTANVRSKQVSGAIEVGMDGVTTKPYRIEELIAHIGGVCTRN